MSKSKYAYGLRTVDADGKAYGGFRWPKRGKVVAPDWSPVAECGHGLHALLNGEGDSDLLSWGPDALWQVVRFDPATMVELDGKVKFPECEVLITGTRAAATQYLHALVSTARIHGLVADGRDLVGGDKANLTAGDGGTATAGRWGTATVGDRGTATAGDGGTATVGYCGTATAGDRGTATAGRWGTATAGEYGVIRIEWWDYSVSPYRKRNAVFYVGEDGIEPNTPYKAICEGRNCRLEKVGG